MTEFGKKLMEAMAASEEASKFLKELEEKKARKIRLHEKAFRLTREGKHSEALALIEKIEA